MTYKEKFNKKYSFPIKESHSLKEISKLTGISLKGIQLIYNKGIGAYKTNPSSVRPSVTSKEQWAYARVYSAVMGGKASFVDRKELSQKTKKIMIKSKYKIKAYSKDKAKKLGLQIKNSTNKSKKIDIFKNGEKIASVGAMGYMDYPSYLEAEKLGKVEKGTADKRRKLYKIRHNKDRNKKNTNSYFADQILW